MKGVCYQMKVEEDTKTTFQKVKRAALSAKEEGAQLFVLPEMFNCPYDIQLFRKYSDYQEETVYFLKALSKETDMLIIGGSIPEKEEEHIYNTCFVLEKGKVLGRHRKRHLFDVDMAEGISFFESKVLTPGRETTVIDTGLGKIGICICFDMRFAELCVDMAQKGAKVIVIPAAFNTHTGPLHWHITGRMRSIDSQCYTVLCAPARDMKASYHSYGHSMVCDPMGQVVASLEEKEGLLWFDLDLSKVDEARRALPLLKEREKDDR